MDATEHTSSTLSFFEGAAEVIQIVHDVVNGVPELSKKIWTFQTRLSHYQEHAELLDPHLEAMIQPLTTALVNAALDENFTVEAIAPICVLLQSVSKVRGHKSVVKFFPVDVKCFVPILTLLSHFRGRKGEGVWETQCQLMLWLSSLTLIPFNLASLDSEGPSVVDRIVEIATGFLHEAGTVREFACILLYRLLTRPDLTTSLQSFMESALETLKGVEMNQDVLYVIGVTQAVSFVFKHGERTALLTHAHNFWPVVSTLMQGSVLEGSLLLRKLGMKLVQRLALTLLEPITPKWRYIQTTAQLGTLPAPTPEAQEEPDYDIPDEMEEVIRVLLMGMADKDTNVRWSASKGIGRVCARLPKELADEVLSFILELFSDSTDDSSWHGACLSVAELARRGLLMPESIPKLVPLIEKALVYDINRGAYSIGANVRDSACYVCWACARSFDAEIVAPFMPKLAPVLMTTACLDREVNCRRAAAAAFQECVGRIGNVPDGMAILECADYFTLSARPNAYLTVAPTVAQFAAYGYDFVSHLLFEKVKHWDATLRQLTADALGKLVFVDLEYFTCDALDHLLSWCLDSSLDTRHGACLTLASVVSALVEHEVEIPEDRLKAVANIVIRIEKARLYRGKGGSLMRQGVCLIIASIAQSHLTRSMKHRMRLLSTVNECIGHPQPEVPPDALKALYALSREFQPAENPEATDATARVYLQHLASENVAFRRGYTMALGQLPKALLMPESRECLEALCGATHIEEKEDDRDAESRANAVKSLTEVVCTLYSSPELVQESFEYLNSILETLFAAMEDYSIDRRGDVGSWIREAAMHGLKRLLILMSCSPALESASVTRVVGYLIRNAVERISSIRQAAIQILFSLMEHEHIDVPQRDALEEMRGMDEDLNAAFATSKGPEAMVSLLQYPEFRVELLLGLMASIGGLEKALSDAVAAALAQFLLSLESDDLDGFMAVFSSLGSQYGRSKRLATPVLMTMDVLCKSPKLFDKLSEKYKSQMIKRVKSSLMSTSDFSRLTTGASILTALAFCERHSTAAWTELLVLLVHPFPFIRKQTAEIIYEKLLFQEDTTKTDTLSQILLETAWDGPIESVRESRDQLCEILQIAAPVRKQRVSKKTDGRATVKMTDENASYKTLVEDFARGMQ